MYPLSYFTKGYYLQGDTATCRLLFQRTGLLPCRFPPLIQMQQVKKQARVVLGKLTGDGCVESEVGNNTGNAL
jgi:hypothetical protein